MGLEKKNINQKKVLFLMPYLFFGGSERQVRYIIEGLEEKNIPVVVLVENGKKTDRENNEYITKHLGIQFVFFNSHTYSTKEKNIFQKIKSLVCIMRWMISNIKKLNIRWVMFTNLTGLLTVPICKSQGCCVLFNERNPGIKMCNKLFKRKLLLMCDKIVANSKSASEYMTKTLRKNVECINNGINIIKPNIDQKCDIVRSKKIILIPARITPIKNQFIILKAALKLKKKLDFLIQFAGPIEDEEYYKKLECYIEKNSLKDYVEFLGYISSIQDYYENADLVILSSYEEGTPNVLLEAYMNKKLCLASDIIMNRNACVDENLLFNVDNSELLKEKILWIFGLTKEEKKEILSKNYTFVCENYGLKRMQDRYIEIFTG